VVGGAPRGMGGAPERVVGFPGGGGRWAVVCGWWCCGNVPEHVFYLTLLNTNPLGKELLRPFLLGHAHALGGGGRWALGGW